MPTRRFQWFEELSDVNDFDVFFEVSDSLVQIEEIVQILDVHIRRVGGGGVLSQTEKTNQNMEIIDKTRTELFQTFWSI